MTDDQSDVIAFLEGKGPGGLPIPEQVVQTHGAVVALYPDAAYKIKRAVKYDYLDFSTCEARHKMLVRELELNGPAAPGLYRDVVPITKEQSGHLAIGGAGPVVDWVLRMKRFPTDAELSVMADQGRIDMGLADALGTSVAHYHLQAPTRTADGAELIKSILEELDRVLSGMKSMLGQMRVETWLRTAREAFDATAELMRQRGASGWVRRCHADLHLRNIIIWEGVPTPFDALEFDEQLGTCDVLYDLAFLLMDLVHRDLADATNLTMNAYLFHVGHDDHLDGLALLPLYMGIRAAIRAMVDVQTSAFQDKPEALVTDALRFMSQAQDYLRPAEPVLVAIGGLSGSGKTSLARRLAAQIGTAPGAVHIRSDLERKAFFRVDPLVRLPQTAYAPDVTQEVHRIMRRKARRALAGGYAVILDSVHNTPQERADARQIATDGGCAFRGFWLDLDTARRMSRVAGRRNDASDADVNVAAQQDGLEIGHLDWVRLDASCDLQNLAQDTLAAISSATN